LSEIPMHLMLSAIYLEQHTELLTENMLKEKI